MSELDLTHEERELLRQYQTLSASIPSLANRLAVEIIPAIAFIAAWAYTGNAVYLVVFIVVTVAYSAQRVIRQYKNIKKLNAIANKAIGETTPGDKP